MPAIEIQEYENSKVCVECPTHYCCKIYDNDDNGIRDKNIWFEEWVENFHIDRDKYGVEPLFNPLEAHMTSNETLRKLLMSMGIDTDWCEYYNPNIGCKIERSKRPMQCRVFKCDRLGLVKDSISDVELSVMVASAVPSKFTEIELTIKPIKVIQND